MRTLLFCLILMPMIGCVPVYSLRPATKPAEPLVLPSSQEDKTGQLTTAVNKVADELEQLDQLLIARVHCAPNCAPCEQLKEHIQAYNGQGRVVFDLVPDQLRPTWVAALEAQGTPFPIVEWQTNDGRRIYQTGWSGLKDFIKKVKKNSRKQAKRAIQSAPPVMYGSTPSQWSWPGDLRRHLASAHGVPLQQVMQMSPQELAALHDQDHNQVGGNVASLKRRRTDGTWPGVVPGTVQATRTFLFGSPRPSHRMIRRARKACPTC